MLRGDYVKAKLVLKQSFFVTLVMVYLVNKTLVTLVHEYTVTYFLLYSHLGPLIVHVLATDK